MYKSSTYDKSRNKVGSKKRVGRIRESTSLFSSRKCERKKKQAGEK